MASFRYKLGTAKRMKGAIELLRERWTEDINTLDDVALDMNRLLDSLDECIARWNIRVLEGDD